MENKQINIFDELGCDESLERRVERYARIYKLK